MLTKLRSNQRALSPIFATLILLAIVTTLFIPVFIWAAGITAQNEESWERSGTAGSERIVVEEVSLKANAESLIFVRNVGQNPITINGIIIQLTDGTGQVFSYDKDQISINPSDPPYVAKGDLMVISVLGDNFESDKPYNVKAFTSNGVSASSRC